MTNVLTTDQPDQALLEQLRQGSAAAFASLYRRYFRLTASQVANFGRSDIQPEDIFQETLLVLVRKVRQPDFELTSRLSTLLFGITRNLLLKKAGRRSEILVEDAKIMRLHEADDSEPEAIREKEALISVIEENLQLLEDDCRELLTFSFFEKLPQAVIALKMGYSEAFVKVKKFRCLDYLRKKVRANPLFNLQT